MPQREKISIVDYQPGDYNELTQIWEKAGLSYKPHGRDSKERIEREVRLDCNRFLFARREGKNIGAILVTHDGRKGWINRVAVLPEYQKLGIARLLVGKAEEWLLGEGIGIFACQIEPGNEGSMAAFQKLGYQPFEGMYYLTKRTHPDI